MLVALRFDVRMHRELPSFISTRGGVALRPGDGVIHSWLNRLLLPPCRRQLPRNEGVWGCISFKSLREGNLYQF